MLVGSLPLLVGSLPLLVGSLPLLVGRLSLLVGRLPLLVGRLPLLVGRLPSLVGSLPLLVGSLPLLVGSLPLLVGSLPLLVGSLPLLVGSFVVLEGSFVLPEGSFVLSEESLSSWSKRLPCPPRNRDSASKNGELCPHSSYSPPPSRSPGRAQLPAPAGENPKVCYPRSVDLPTQSAKDMKVLVHRVPFLFPFPLLVALSCHAGGDLGESPSRAVVLGGAETGPPSGDAEARAGSSDEGGTLPADASDDPWVSVDGASFLTDAGLDFVQGGPGLTVCGPRVCNAASEVCCARYGDDIGYGFLCTPINACPGGLIFECSSDQSCGAGLTCCSVGGGDAPVESSACHGVPECIQVCEMTSQCPVGTRCGTRFEQGIGTCVPALDGG